MQKSIIPRQTFVMTSQTYWIEKMHDDTRQTRKFKKYYFFRFCNRNGNEWLDLVLFLHAPKGWVWCKERGNW